MALTKVSTDGVKDDAITKTKIPANQIEASELADNAVDTNAIADQAVSLSKLPHGTSSNDGKFLRANNGADPSFETVSIPAGTTINNNADNRVITGSGTANTLNGESSVVIDANGKLGVGNTNPADFDAYADRLVVGTTSGNNGMTIVAGSSNSSSIYFADGTSGGSQKNAGIVDYNHSTDKMRFATAANDAMVIDSSRRVGIGTTSPNSYALVTVNDSNGISLTGSTQTRIVMQHANGGTNLKNFDIQTSDGNLRFRTIGDNNTSVTERLRIQSGGGISFNGDSAAANALDDYEEGTFTATMNSSNNDASFNSGQTTTGLYTKIGGLVYVTMYFGCNIASSGSGVAMISGLPFASNSSTYYALTITHSTLTQSTLQNGYVQYGNTIFYPIRENATGGSALNAGNPRYIMIAGCYPAW